MAGEKLFVATHISIWLDFDGTRLRQGAAERLKDDVVTLKDAGFEVFNVAHALDYDLSESRLRQIYPESQNQINACDAFIHIMEENESDSIGKDKGRALSLGKLVLLAHSGFMTVTPTDKFDVEHGKAREISAPLDPVEITDILKDSSS